MARREERGVTGIFAGLAPCVSAVRALKSLGRRDLRVFSPFSSPEIQEALGKRPSPLGYATLVAAITGTVSGFAISIFTSYKYGLITGGQPLSAWIPYGVIGFELTILFGCLANFAAMLLLAGIPRFSRPAGYEERFSVDRCGVFVPLAAGSDSRAVRELLSAHGAEEVLDRV